MIFKGLLMKLMAKSFWEGESLTLIATFFIYETFV